MPTSDLTTASGAVSGAVDASLQLMIDQASADLAATLHIDRSSIATVSARTVVWPDASAGCAKAGMKYQHIAVEGALIELRANGATYRYHFGGPQHFMQCANGS